MRKLIMLLLAGVLIISLVGCGNTQNKNQKVTTESSSEETSKQENVKRWFDKRYNSWKSEKCKSR